MSGWVPMPADGWSETAELLTSTGRPWPESSVVFDLRWHADQGVRLPGADELRDRWHWPRARVRALLDPRAEASWRDKDTKGGARPLQRTGQVLAGRARVVAASDRPATGQRPASDRPAPERDDAENQADSASDRPATGQRPASDRPANARGILPPDHPTTRRRTPPTPSPSEGAVQRDEPDRPTDEGANQRAVWVARWAQWSVVDLERRGDHDQAEQLRRDLEAPPAAVVDRARALIDGKRGRGGTRQRSLPGQPEAIRRRDIVRGLRLASEWLARGPPVDIPAELADHLRHPATSPPTGATDAR